MVWGYRLNQWSKNLELPSPIPDQALGTYYTQASNCQTCGIPLNYEADGLPNTPVTDTLEVIGINGQTTSVKTICTRCHTARHQPQNLDALPAAHVYTWSDEWRYF